VTRTSRTYNGTWFRIRYADTAPEGLPPVIQAEQVLRYGDAAGIWLVALWANTQDREAAWACILRIPADYVDGVTRYDTWSEAMNDLLFGPSASS
jgi:hypothetical protein